jgi:preprotein translocase subunit SecA
VEPLKKVFEKIFGTYSERELKKLDQVIEKIEALEAQYKGLSEEALKNKTVEFKERLAQGETLDEMLPEAFATVREASYRVLGNEALSCAIIWRGGTSSGKYC